MSPAEQAVLASLSAEAKAAAKELLLDIIDKEIPAIVAAEVSKIGVYGPMIQSVVGGFYPQVEAMVDAKIAALLA